MKKTIIVLLLFLCAFSGVVTIFKYANFKNKEQEIIKDIEKAKEIKENEVQEEQVFKDRNIRYDCYTKFKC